MSENEKREIIPDVVESEEEKDMKEESKKDIKENEIKEKPQKDMKEESKKDIKEKRDITLQEEKELTPTEQLFEATEKNKEIIYDKKYIVYKQYIPVEEPNNNIVKLIIKQNSKLKESITSNDEKSTTQKQQRGPKSMKKKDFETQYKQLEKENKLDTITSLDLSFNKFTDESFKEFMSGKTLPKLKDLNLSNNKFTKIPDYVVENTQITRLEINNNQITTLNDIDTKGNLHALQMRNNKLKSIRFENFPNAINFVSLDVTDNYINDIYDPDNNFYYCFHSMYFQKVPTKIRDNIYLGSVNSTTDRQIYRELNIKSVISLGKKPHILSSGEHLFIDIEDSSQSNLKAVFNTVFTHMDHIIKHKGSVLVHCECGVSRSSSIVIGYLMKKERRSFDDVLKEVTTLRQCVYPNKGFIEQLKKFQTEIKIDSSKRNSDKKDKDGQQGGFFSKFSRKLFN